MWSKKVLWLTVLQPAYGKSKPKMAILMRDPQIYILTCLYLLKVLSLLAHRESYN